MTIETFADVKTAIAKNPSRNFHLLLGNGFSMAFDPNIFSYNALYDFVASLDDDLLSKVLGVLQTKNFEQMMIQLASFSRLAEVFGADHALVAQAEATTEKLKQSLIDAIKSLHPEHVFEVPEERCNACAAFLTTFLSTGGNLFTSNYDLLLYWVLMRSTIASAGDGFGRDREDDEGYNEDSEYSELRWGRNIGSQRVFYVHGALPLFDTGIEIIKEEYGGGRDYLLEVINRRIISGHYPVFVTAGTGDEKLHQIMHNRYLAHCYETLSSITGSLVTFGFNFGPYDEHIIEAINKAAKLGRKQFPKLLSVYIGVYSEQDRSHIESIANKFNCKIHTFDARTAPVWNG
jgi:hypothetical protein